VQGLAQVLMLLALVRALGEQLLFAVDRFPQLQQQEQTTR
jgi:hypothetical protein